MELTDPGFIALLRKGDREAFEKLFKAYFNKLHVYAFLVVKQEQLAEEIVQLVFARIWEKREKLDIHHSLNAYLYKSVYHECLYEIKREKYKTAYKSHVTKYKKEVTANDNASQKLEEKELEKRLQQALAELPEQCLVIFQLNRFEEMKYKEIAQHLGLSLKTVENQMGKALKRLRKSLGDLLPFLI